MVAIMKVDPLPTQTPKEAGLTSMEPWDLPSAAAALKLPLAEKWAASADRLRVEGHWVLPEMEQAVWFAYQREAKRPLSGDLTWDVVREHVVAFLDVTTSLLPKAHALAEKLVESRQRTTESLVTRMGTIGLFATRGPIRSVTLPEWCKAAVLTNTLSGKTEVTVTIHHPLIDLSLWFNGPAGDGASFVGHRYRIRSDQQLTMRQLQFVLYGLHSVIDHARK